MTSENPGCLAAIFGINPFKQQRVKTYTSSKPVQPKNETESSDIVAKKKASVPKFSSKGILLTNAEVSFFHVLRNMTKDQLVIFPHVALRDLVSIVVDQSEYFTYFNKIDRKQVDFVLCDPKSLKPIFVVELDDSSHRRPDRIVRDSFVENVLEDAKIPLVRIPVAPSYDVEKLRPIFKNAFDKYLAFRNETPNQQYTLDNPPLCPKHGVRMVLRKARQSGENFWGCPNYPQCREIIKLRPS
jgi:very-short-patch-repair endonuclease